MNELFTKFQTKLRLDQLHYRIVQSYNTIDLIVVPNAKSTEAADVETKRNAHYC